MAHQFSKPSAEGMRSRDVGDLAQFSEADVLGLEGEALALPVVESETLAMDLFEHSDFLLLILTDRLLLTVHAARQAEENGLSAVGLG